MKNSIKICALGIVLLAACKKSSQTDNVTIKTVAPHYATITLTGKQYYSIKKGEPSPAITATAYDSTTNEVCAVTMDASGVDNTTPGLYPVAMNTRNTDGYFSSLNAFVAVTDIPEAANLAGEYVRNASGVSVDVEEVANGLYSINNFFGAGTTVGATAYFVMVNDSTIAMPSQETNFGFLRSSDHFLSQLPGDTTVGWILRSLTTNTAKRTFTKQ